ncbi:hypothetical protein, partial [Nocardia wallacei]|uniref:hypothetical protein n=1 Tax=Nocardia wallacei TaxID=480035 RepID=UPI002455B278
MLAALALTAGIGWFLTPEDGPATAAVPPGSSQLEFTATAVSIGGIASATALIVAVLIVGAALIGAFCYAPRGDAPQTPRGGRPPTGAPPPRPAP